MSDFLAAASAGHVSSISLAEHAEVRENSNVIALADTAWKEVKSIKSKMTFADSVSGNVVSRVGVELADGKPGYISTRLKIAPGGAIIDVELSSDTSDRVVADYVWKLDPQLEAVLPPEQRMTRMNLEALALRYFNSLSTHIAVKADFEERCNRYHSGQQITNVARNTVESGPARTCAGSLEGDPPWGPATQQRFPVIDEERGIVVGITLLQTTRPNQSKMYVSEVFKVVDGRIVTIDNIGLVQQITTLGFTH